MNRPPWDPPAGRGLDLGTVCELLQRVWDEAGAFLILILALAIWLLAKAVDWWKDRS